MRTDDSPKSIKARMNAVYCGKKPTMPGLYTMTRKEMTDALQSIWTLCDETGVQRRNETAPQIHLSIYGRVYAAIENGTLAREDS